MKLSKGMFIRTPSGIDKIKTIYQKGNPEFVCYFLTKSNSILKWDYDTQVYYFSIDGKVFDKDEIKINKELIELVEPMDLMYIDVDPNDGYGGITVPRVAETLNELKKWKQRFASGECILKGVVTREQLMNDCYWVGE